MTFYEVVGQVLELLRHQGRVSYRALKREFDIDDEFIEDLKAELLYAHPVVDDEGRGLIWTDDAKGRPVTVDPPNEPEPQPVVEPTQPVQATPTFVESRPPEAERRQLTIMFCDLVGSTSLSGSLDPEELRDVIRAYQFACTGVIQRFEGYVAQHLGDGLLVYFGYPIAHEDDAERAVRTGLGVIEAMEVLNPRLTQTHGVQLAVRIGIHTGLTVIGGIGAG